MREPANRIIAPIDLTGAVRRSFIFPAPLTEAFDFYSNLPGDFSLLPHIRLVQNFKSGCFRLKYETVELSLYRVRMYCDVAVQTEHLRQIAFTPCLEETPITEKAGLYSLTGKGFYQSTSEFEPFNDQTLIHFQLDLHAKLPVPFGLALVPEAVRNRIADSISRLRIKEIAEAFIDRSIESYRLGTKGQV